MRCDAMRMLFDMELARIIQSTTMAPATSSVEVEVEVGGWFPNITSFRGFLTSFRGFLITSFRGFLTSLGVCAIRIPTRN